MKSIFEAGFSKRAFPSNHPSPSVYRKANPNNNPIYFIVLKNCYEKSGDLYYYVNDENS